DLAVREEASGKAHAAHLQTFAQLRIEALADDELGAAAADIHHQPLSGCAMEGMRDTRVDQARLLASGDDLDLMVENLFRAANELRPVAGFAQRVGADDAHRALGQMVDQLGEAAQAIQATLHGRFIELSSFVDAGRELNLLAEP